MNKEFKTVSTEVHLKQINLKEVQVTMSITTVSFKLVIFIDLHTIPTRFANQLA